MKNLPQIIILFWLLCLCIVNSVWYKTNIELINTIDTIVVGISLLHYFIYYQKYSQTAKYCIKCIITTLFIHFLYYNFDLNDQTYYIFYGINLAITLYFCIKQNWNK